MVERWGDAMPSVASILSSLRGGLSTAATWNRILRERVRWHRTQLSGFAPFSRKTRKTGGSVVHVTPGAKTAR